ncbi:MAG TPA: phosphotransferase family protein, partial [Actinomycetota bacterium]|nr:phosphotransferase family protein [Actinomycetota bacterium]
LGHFIEATLPQLGGPFEIERLGEGLSCLTFALRGEGWEVVLRRPPRGNLPPTAYDVTREYRVMRALSDAGAEVPVPRPLALCRDPSVIGAPFYLMEPVWGPVVRSELPEVLSTAPARRAISEHLVDTLAALHAIDYASVGLEDFGKPDGYLERQLRRMGELWDRARFRDIPEIDEVGRWLGEHLPTQRGSTILHGDYKLDNVILSLTSPPRIRAVVDWEMSTLGDPLADLGWLLYFWFDPGEPAFDLPVATVTDCDGFLRRPELLERYAERVGTDTGQIGWYVALAGWKIAIIMEGAYGRYLAGVADHAAFVTLERAVLALAHRALQVVRGELGT